MTGHKPTVESKADKTPRPKHQKPVAQHQAAESVSQSEPALTELASTNPALDGQSEHLRNRRIQQVQRQALASYIGQVGGNEHLTRVVRNVQRKDSNPPIQRSPLSEELELLWNPLQKGTFFQRLRTLNVSDPDVDAMVNRTLTGDDLWLAHNLIFYGPEANWPIELRVEREMKGWADSGGKGAVFKILREAGGSAASNAALSATLSRIFIAGSDDLMLAQNLQAYGPEASWPAPTANYVIPFDRAPLSAAGEQIIFGADYTWPQPNDYHEIVYTGKGGRFERVDGPASVTYKGLRQSNVYFFIDQAWDGKSELKVTMDVRVRSNNHIAITETWNFGKKENYPTEIKQLEDENERPLPSTYSYKVGPDLGDDKRDDYLHQTILETFGQRACNITVDELKPEFRQAHPEITTPDAITAYFFGSRSNNGTFTVSAGDMIYDRHSGGMPNLNAFTDALTTMKEVYVDLPQTYEAKPGVALGRFTVRRIIKPDGRKMLKKMKVT